MKNEKNIYYAEKNFSSLIQNLDSGKIPENLLSFKFDKLNFSLTGIIKKTNFLNGNNRILPFYIAEKTNAQYNNLLVKNKISYGELEHPSDEFDDYDCNEIIHKNRISHIVTKTWFEGYNLMGRVELLNTTSGILAKKHVEKTGNIGVSIRMVSSVKNKQIQEDALFLCFDLVKEDPSENIFLYKVKS